MKKFLFILLFCISFTYAYSYWGVGVKYGAAPKSGDINGNKPTEIKGDKHFVGIEFIYEYEAEIDALGISLGLNMYQYLDVTYKKYYSYWYIYEESEDIGMFSIPLTIYYKYKILPYFSAGIGTGMTMISTNSASCTNLFPHVDFGIEYKPLNWFGIGVDWVYNTRSSILNDKSNAHRDIDGISTNIATRFYF